MKPNLLKYAAILLALVTTAHAQQSRQSLESANNALINANGRGAITGPVVNSMFNGVITSAGMQNDANVWTGPNTFSGPNVAATRSSLGAAALGANTDITSLTASTITPTNVVADGALVINAKYKITSTGTSNFVQAGALANTVGTWFVATATGSNTPGTGTVTTGTETVSGQLLISNSFTDPNAPQGFRSNYTQRGNFSGAVSFHSLSCTYGGVGYQTAYGTGTTCANVSFSPTAIVPDGKGLFIINQTYKIVALGNTDWPSLGYIGTPVVGGTFVATATQSSVVGGTGTASAPFWTYAGKEFFTFTGAVVIAVGNPGASDSDLVGVTGAVTINDTTEGVISDGHFVVGNYYTITSLGSSPTNFVSIGASANQLGVQFKATGISGGGNGQGKATGSHAYPGFFTLNASGAGEFPIGNPVKVEEALSCVNNVCAQVRYLSGAHVQRNGDIDVSGHLISAGAFTVGEVYVIASAGNTNFTLIGSVDSNVGTSFIATGPGTGTGTATESATSGAYMISAAGRGGAAQAFHYGMLLAQHVPSVSSGVRTQPLAFDASLIGYDDPTPCFPNQVFTVGPIASGTITSGGSGYANGRYPPVNGGIFLTGGTGTFAIAIINVTGGVVTNVQLESVGHGTGYTVGDVLSANSADIGGGSGFTWTVTGVSQPIGGCPAAIANWINLPNMAVTGYLFNSPHYTMTGAGDGVQTSITLTGQSPANPPPLTFLEAGVVIANTAGAFCGAGPQWCKKGIAGIGVVDGVNPVAATVTYEPLYHP